MSMAELEMMAQNQTEAEAEAEVEAEMSLTDGGTLQLRPREPCRQVQERELHRTQRQPLPAHLWMCQCNKTARTLPMKQAVSFEG